MQDTPLDEFVDLVQICEFMLSLAMQSTPNCKGWGYIIYPCMSTRRRGHTRGSIQPDLAIPLIPFFICLIISR